MAGAVPKYTLAEVRQRNGIEKTPCWIVYKDGVYDVTEFLLAHPGGMDAILEEGGRNATKAFNNIGHSADARTIMAKYKVGELVDEEKVYENGKRKVIAVSEGESRSCMNIISCGLIG